MTSPTRALVIDARPRGPHGPLAGERVLGRSVLAHLVDMARECEPNRGPIAVHARVDEHASFLKLIDNAPSVVLRTGPPPEGAAILRSDRLYDAGRLRRVLKSGRDPESAVVWRLDRPEALASAESEMIRRRSYQPIGRFWALAPATALARKLAPTRVHPNAVTISAFVLMIGAAVISATRAGIAWNFATATMLALALVLDTSDGHLARLQGTASEFGRWLDAVLDEFADVALHSAIAWGLFARSGNALWLALGMAYTGGKYLFVIAQQGGEPAAGAPSTAMIARPSFATSTVRMIGHADVRWHLWIVLAALGRLEWALIAYAAYFPTRTMAMAARKAVHRAA